MSVKDIVIKSIQIDILNESGVLKGSIWMPPGWNSIFNECYDAIINLGGLVQRVFYSKGTLQIISESNTPATRWLAQGLAKESSVTCLIYPNQRAMRRKAYDGWPPLCARAWVEYANELEGSSNHVLIDETIFIKKELSK